MENINVISENKNGYLINYIFSKTSYPYYLLTEIEVYKDNNLCVHITSNEREYDGYIMGSEYKSIIVETLNEKRVIEFNTVNMITSDNIVSKNSNCCEIDYYENQLFEGNIIYFFLCKKNECYINIEKKQNLLKRILRVKNNHKKN